MNNKVKLLLIASLAIIAGIAGYMINNFQNSFALSGGEVEGIRLSFGENSGYAVGDKVYGNLSLDNSMWKSTIMLTFKSLDSGREFSVYLKDTNYSNPYFIVPQSAIVNESYNISSITLISEEGNEMTFSTSESDTYPYINVGKYNLFKFTPRNIEDDTLLYGKLNSFSIKTTNVKEKERVYLNVGYEGTVDIMSIALKNTSNGQILYRNIIDYEINKPYFELAGNIAATSGSYQVKHVSLCTNNDCITYYNVDLYGETGGMQQKPFKFNELLTVEPINNSLKLVAVNLNTYDSVIGKKVSIDVNANKDLKSALAIFYDKENNQAFSAYVKNLHAHGYFMLPSTTNEGNYRLQTLIIQDKEGNISSATIPEFSGDSFTDENGTFYEKINLRVRVDEVKDKNNLVFNNEDFDDLISKKIESLSNTAVITVICDNDPNISRQLFKLISETRRTLIIKYFESEWVFSGVDIIDPKPIDVGMLITSIKESDFSNSNISNIVSNEDSSVLSFANNGTLPGKALIRLNSVELDYKFSNKDIFVYYYNDKEDSLMKVALEVQKIEGYYEFYINHNSEYILSSKKINDKYVSKDENMLELNIENDQNEKNVLSDNRLMYLISGLLGIIVILMLVIIIKKRK